MWVVGREGVSSGKLGIWMECLEKWEADWSVWESGNLDGVSGKVGIWMECVC